MNTLSRNFVKDAIHSWRNMREALSRLHDDSCAFPVSVRGLHGALYSYFTNEYCSAHAVTSLQHAGGVSVDSSVLDTVIVVPGEREAFDVRTDLSTSFPEAEVVFIPWWGAIPYRPAAKGAAVFGERAAALAKLAVKSRNALSKTPRIFIMTQRTFQSPLPPPEIIKSHTFAISKTQKIDTVKTAKTLSLLGYTRVPRVYVPGEFSVRGEVLDVFVPGNDEPVRIMLDFDTVAHIKTFDADSQMTTRTLEAALIAPMKEVIWDDALVSCLREKLDAYEKTALSAQNVTDDAQVEQQHVHLPFTENAKAHVERIIAELAASGASEGEELLYPVLWNGAYTLRDYIGKNASVLFFDFDRLINAEGNMMREYEGMYRKARLDFPALSPSYMLHDLASLLETFSRCLLFHTLSHAGELADDESALHNDAVADTSTRSKTSGILFSCEPSRSFFGNITFLKEELTRLHDDGWKIAVFADGENQRRRVAELLRDIPDVVVFPEAISHGFSIPDIKLLVIQENELFGRRKAVPKSLKRAKSAALDTFIELNPGDYVVHVQYGIGIFRGIERVKTAGNERDYIKLVYADEEFAFVPIEQVNMVQRYIGSEGEKPRVDKIGSKAWENRKNRVQQAVEDVAKKLIDLYSRRKASSGFPFPKDTEWQTSFEAAFPYEDTPDQMTVSEEVKRDMEKPVPMDRLICGDVGYGKTEIAMRAAFKAVMGGKQVVFLAPTTILAEQHYETCIERFAHFPVTVAMLSRFVSHAEQKKILEKLARGDIDMLIGTHRVIQKDVAFKNLGLMIIDEEQRFGVKDKEKLKELKANIDALSLSATPIPRTLHMSLLKIRDMSLLTTPPQNRQEIETVIEPYSDARVAAAIRREVERGGQVFFLHNRVESLLETRRQIEQLVPEMIVDIAHGQMTAVELEDIFRRFKLGGFHVLVSTTIIENGIDIPNVNTIVIDRADMYGVSQLYQLRGRVGRSDRKAYAFLFYPKNASLSEVAMKRLQVISDFTELGSGFKIAMKDMEIRGAGNLLGKDQSGDVYAVGFDLYLKLLNEAVERLTAAENYKTQSDVLMEFEYTGFIPDSYVQTPQTKMEIYKKIASVQSNEDLIAVMNEIEDRFGPVPDEVASLLSLAEIRILCKRLSISSIKERNGVVHVTFARVSDINIDNVLRLIKDSAGSVKLDAAKPNMLFLQLGAIGLKEKSEYIREHLERLA